MKNVTVYRKTYSICPVCRKQLPAKIVKRKSGWYMEKCCSEHGEFKTAVWRGGDIPFESWGKYTPPKESTPPPCPASCGLCDSHLQDTCCVLVELTGRCDLNCPYCFAQSGIASGYKEKTPAELYYIFHELVQNGRSFVQLSGGEPCVRDDLPEITAVAKKAGCDSIQLNSNGLRLGRDPDFAKKLADSGLSFVFMQFDGLSDDVYLKLRGRALLKEKLDAIEVCDKYRLGVTLVPTIVPGVNDGQIGEIIKFAVEHSPAVRGVHFQPVSYFGRYPETPDNNARITLPEIVTQIESQTGGLIFRESLLPSACDHPRCGFHGDFIVTANKSLIALTNKGNASCCSKPGDKTSEALKNRRFVARRWKRQAEPEQPLKSENLSELDVFAERVKSHGFTITGMAFQDAYNIDFERLRRCSLHVYDNGRIVPFCSYYLAQDTAYDRT